MACFIIRGYTSFTKESLSITLVVSYNPSHIWDFHKFSTVVHHKLFFEGSTSLLKLIISLSNNIHCISDSCIMLMSVMQEIEELVRKSLSQHKCCVSFSVISISYGEVIARK